MGKRVHLRNNGIPTNVAVLASTGEWKVFWKTDKLCFSTYH